MNPHIYFDRTSWTKYIQIRFVMIMELIKKDVVTSFQSTYT